MLLFWNRFFHLIIALSSSTDASKRTTIFKPSWSRQFVYSVSACAFSSKSIYLFFLTSLISKVPILHSNIHQLISFQKQDVANLNLSAFWELSVNTTCKSGTIRAVPTSCQQSDIETEKRRVTPASGWRLGNLICLLLSRKEATVGYPCLCAWTCKRAFCAVVRNRVPGMHGACPSVCLHMINHSTWNPFTMVESGQWTT